MDKKLDIIPLSIKEDLEELFGYLWHLRNPIEAIRTGGINGIGDYHDQLHVLKSSLNKLIIHTRNLLPDSDYLIDDLKQGFNINNWFFSNLVGRIWEQTPLNSCSLHICI